MSKMYKRNAGNTAWDEVKKGFKVRSGSRWVSPKKLKYYYGGKWNEHSFTCNRIFGITPSYVVDKERLKELNPDTFAVIGDKGTIGPDNKGLGGVGQSLYTSRYENGRIVERSPETAVVIRVVGYTNQPIIELGGIRNRLFACYTFTDFYNYAMIAEINKSNGSLIKTTRGRTGTYGIVQLGGTSSKLYSNELETYKTGGTVRQYIRAVNLSTLNDDTILGIVTIASFTGISSLGGSDDNLYACGAFKLAELNPISGVVLRQANAINMSSIAGLKNE